MVAARQPGSAGETRTIYANMVGGDITVIPPRAITVTEQIAQTPQLRPRWSPVISGRWR